MAISLLYYKTPTAVLCVISRRRARVFRRFPSVKGFTILDTLITLCLIGIFIGFIIPRFQRTARAAQEEALRTGLMNIRTSITLFKVVNGRHPDNLRELIEKNMMLPARIGSGPLSGSVFKQKYLITNAVDAQGNILDTFGNRFLYDPVLGEVRSSTPGFEQW